MAKCRLQSAAAYGLLSGWICEGNTKTEYYNNKIIDSEQRFKPQKAQKILNTLVILSLWFDVRKEHISFENQRFS